MTLMVQNDTVYLTVVCGAKKQTTHIKDSFLGFQMLIIYNFLAVCVLMLTTVAHSYLEYKGAVNVH